MISDISISKTPSRNVRRSYYAGIAMRYGYADDQPRAANERVIIVKPTRKAKDVVAADKFAVGQRPGRRLTAPERDPTIMVASAEAVRQLAELYAFLLPRVSTSPSAAVWDAMDDVAGILRGEEPIAMGEGRLDVLRALVRVLSRHA